MSRKTWRCFHCDEVLYSEKQALIHFGNPDNGYEYPACRLTHHEGHLVEYIRRLEAELTEYRRETHDLLIAAYSMQMDTRALVPEAEQRGYDKGVADTWAMANAESGGRSRSEPNTWTPPVGQAKRTCTVCGLEHYTDSQETPFVCGQLGCGEAAG